MLVLHMSREPMKEISYWKKYTNNINKGQGKGLTISGTNSFGDVLRQVTKVGVSLRQ